MSNSKQTEDFTSLGDAELDSASGGRRITSVSVVPGMGGYGAYGAYGGGYPMGAPYAAFGGGYPAYGAGAYSPYGFGMGACGTYGYGFGCPGYRLGTAL
jgi:hypothetical protein